MVHVRLDSAPRTIVAQVQGQDLRKGDILQNGRRDVLVDVVGSTCDSEQKAEEIACNEKHHRWINRQITSAAGSGDLMWLLDVIQEHLDQMNLINSSTALHRTAKLVLGSSSRVREQILQHDVLWRLQQVVTHQVAQLENNATEVLGQSIKNTAGGGFEGCEMRCVSIICWSCATLRVCEEPMFRMVAKVSEARFKELKPFELSNMLWAFAKLSLSYTSLVNGVSPQLLARKDGQFSPQCLSTIVWSLGTMKVNHAALFTSFAAEIAAAAHTMAPQGIANTAWAFARVRRQEAPLFRALASAACRESVVWTFKPQELSNTAWAFATVGLPHARLFERIAEVAIFRRMDLPPQNMANILWAYAKLLVSARTKLFPVLLKVATSRMVQYKPQEVSAIVWAAAKEEGCPTCHAFFLSVPRVFSTRLREFTCQALACMVEAFTLAGVDGNGFLDAMVQESLTRLASFLPPSLCTLFRGMTLKAIRDVNQNQDSAGSFTARRLHEVSMHILSRIRELPPHNLVNLKQTIDMLQDCAQLMPCVQALAGAPALCLLPDVNASVTNGAHRSAEDGTAASSSRPGGADGLKEGRRRRRRGQPSSAADAILGGNKDIEGERHAFDAISIDGSSGMQALSSMLPSSLAQDDDNLEDVGLVPEPPEACLEHPDIVLGHNRGGGGAGGARKGRDQFSSAPAGKNGPSVRGSLGQLGTSFEGIGKAIGKGIKPSGDDSGLIEPSPMTVGRGGKSEWVQADPSKLLTSQVQVPIDSGLQEDIWEPPPMLQLACSIGKDAATRNKGVASKVSISPWLQQQQPEKDSHVEGAERNESNAIRLDPEPARVPLPTTLLAGDREFPQRWLPWRDDSSSASGGGPSPLTSGALPGAAVATSAVHLGQPRPPMDDWLSASTSAWMEPPPILKQDAADRLNPQFFASAPPVMKRDWSAPPQLPPPDLAPLATSMQAQAFFQQQLQLELQLLQHHQQQQQLPANAFGTQEQCLLDQFSSRPPPSNCPFRLAELPKADPGLPQPCFFDRATML